MYSLNRNQFTDLLCKSIDWFIYDSSIVRRTWLIDIITLSLLSILNIISLWNNFSCGLTYNCLVGSLFFRSLQTKNSIIFLCITQARKWDFTLREKCPYSEFFWSIFFCIWTPYAGMRENADLKNSEYGRLGSEYRSTLNE